MLLKVGKPSSPVFGKTRDSIPDLGPYKKHTLEPMCKTCRYAMRGKFGYRNARCYKYQKESGKPSAVLFDGAKCPYYRKDRSDKKE